MALIQKGDSQKKLREAYAIEGGGPSPVLAPEIVPVTLVDDLSQDPNDETRNVPCIGHGNAGATAAEYSYVQLWNLPDSGFDLYVEACWVYQATAAEIAIKHYNIALTGGGTWSTYQRVLNGKNPLLQFPVYGKTSASNLLGTSLAKPYVGTSPVLIPMGVTIGPGYSLALMQETVNIKLRVEFFFTMSKK